MAVFFKTIAKKGYASALLVAREIAEENTAEEKFVERQVRRKKWLL